MANSDRAGDHGFTETDSKAPDEGDRVITPMDLEQLRAEEEKSARQGSGRQPVTPTRFDTQGLTATLSTVKDKPFTRHRATVDRNAPYCIRLQVWLIDLEQQLATDQPPPEHAWNDGVVGDVAREMILELHEACVTNPGITYLFMAPRYSRYGLSHEDKLSGPTTWIGHLARMTSGV